MFDIFSTKFAQDIFLQKYSMNQQESWADMAKRVVDNVCGQYLDNETKERIYKLILERKFIPGGRYLYSAGRAYHQVNNCFLFRAEDSRESWADIMHKTTAALMTGGGIGVNYSKLRPDGAKITRTGGESTGPMALMHMVNEAGRYIMQGGTRRSAIWAGLNWSHGDIEAFLKLKDWTPELKKLKEKDLTFHLPMELTNISVIYDTEFFVAIENKQHELHKLAKKVWLENCKQAFKSAEPGMSFNFLKDNESLRNACTEVTSEDDSDKCNLGTLWINRFDNKEDFGQAVKDSTMFLLCGGQYSDVPTKQIKKIGDKNNRIGLGLGGIHEWLMLRECDYQVTPKLHKWLNVYEQESDAAAHISSKELGVSIPKGKRAIAPTGTIGILAETTTGIEPLFCKAYKRRYLKGKKWHYQYVIDGTVKRLLDKGVKLEHIQDAYDIPFKERVKFQADVQNYVDMAISSTCNLSEWGNDENNESNIDKKAKILLKYAKRLRGFTCYPDGSRGGQPLTRVDLKKALKKEGKVFEENEHQCVGGICGI